MEFESNRRRFLELAGPTTAAALAGCGSLPGGPSSSVASETVTQTDGPAEARTVGVSVEPDQQALQERQAELRSELQAGNINRSEAQQRYRRIQDELRTEAMESFREHVDTVSALSIEGTVDQFALFLLVGSPTALIDTLSVDGVVGLLPRATFDEAQSQATTTAAQN